MTQEDKDKVIRLYKKGLSTMFIKATMGYTWDFVKETIKEAGIGKKRGFAYRTR